MEYYEFIFELEDQGQRDILVALLSDIGFAGFEEEDDELKAFISTGDFKESLFNETLLSFDTIKYSRSIIQETNWNAQWESGFDPVTVLHPVTKDPFVHIRAGFHKPSPGTGFDIIITPKMSFGTGHHATTYLVAEQMSRIGFTGKHVIDFGTGTAVLAILAEKLGASKVTAIDNDDWSIANANENIMTNNCKNISILKAETIPSGEQAAVILANINLNIIIENITAIKNACVENASVIFSGIMIHDESKILEALKNMNFHVEDILRRNEWIAIMAKTQGNL